MFSKEKNEFAVCFDYRGTLIDHNSDRRLIPEIESILFALKKEKIPMALVSRFPTDILKDRLGPLEKYFGEHIYSGGGKEKLECILQFAEKLGIKKLSRIVFVDDKPDNFVPVALDSDIDVIGFAGSGKYPESAEICKEQGIPYAESVEILKRMIFEKIAIS